MTDATATPVVTKCVPVVRSGFEKGDRPALWKVGFAAVVFCLSRNDTLN
jgi:hypothetical protein